MQVFLLELKQQLLCEKDESNYWFVSYHVTNQISFDAEMFVEYCEVCEGSADNSVNSHKRYK